MDGLLQYGVAGLLALVLILVIKEIFGYFNKSKPSNGNGDTSVKQVLQRLSDVATEQRETAIKDTLSSLVLSFEKHLSTDYGMKDALEKIAKAVENSNMILALVQERMRVHDENAASRHHEAKQLWDENKREIKSLQEKCRKDCKEEHEKIEAISVKK